MRREGRKDQFISIWILLLAFCMIAAVTLSLYDRASSDIPDYVGRPLNEKEQTEVIERNSLFTEYVYLTPNADFPRERKIKKITIHHMAGNLNLKSLGFSFAEGDRRVSANYGIDTDGKVALYVEECNRAWSSSNKENDDMAVTIEVANDRIGDDWHVSDAAYETLIQLCADICRRHGISELLFTGDATGNLTLHKMFYEETQCPGPYLESKMPQIADAVNRLLAKSDNI